MVSQKSNPQKALINILAFLSQIMPSNRQFVCICVTNLGNLCQKLMSWGPRWRTYSHRTHHPELAEIKLQRLI